MTITSSALGTLGAPTTPRRRRSTSPDAAPVWAAAWRTDTAPDAPVTAPAVADAPVLTAPRGWRDRLWQVVGLLAVVLPMLGLVVAAWTGQEIWLLPAAAVAALVAVALTIWT